MAGKKTYILCGLAATGTVLSMLFGGETIDAEQVQMLFLSGLGATLRHGIG